MNKIVIVADDLGYCKERDDGILECFENGAISASSVLLNGASFASAVERARAVGLPLNLHLNLTEGKPVTGNAADVIPSLVDNDGQFLGKHGFHEQRRLGTVLDKDVVTEVRAQILHFQRLVLQTMPACPDCGRQSYFHVDGHNHCHVAEGMPELLAPLFAELGVMSVRVPVEQGLSSEDQLPSPFLRDIHRRAQASVSFFSNHHISFIPCFIGMQHNNFQSLIFSNNKSSNKKFELMTHPGYKQLTGPGDEFSKSLDRDQERLRLIDLSLTIMKKQQHVNFQLSRFCCLLK